MRLFVAVAIPPEIREALRRLVGELRSEIRGPRWVRPEGIHLTLRFLGEVEEPSLPGLVAELERSLPGSVTPFDVEVAGIGVFPERGRPRVLWVGLDEAGDRLSTLQRRVESAVATAVPNLKKETRPFAPHLTLARFGDARPPAGLGATIARYGGERRPRLGTFTVMSVHLLQSLLGPGGAEYRQLGEYRL